MITYTYRCDACGHRFEARQRMTDEALRVCPACGGPVKRVITGGLGTLGITHDSSRACSFSGGG